MRQSDNPSGSMSTDLLDEFEPLVGANVKTVPNRSPFRYPGGKTWLIEHIRDWLGERGGEEVELVEPFAGGAIVALTAVAEDLVGSAVLVEKDRRVRDVWRAILGRSGRKLAEQIQTFQFDAVNVRAELEREGGNLRERAFRTILENRVSRNGIIAPSGGLLNRGENGAGKKSRWYPETLSQRILDIVALKNRLSISSYTRGLRYMRSRKDDEHLVFFIDPPYPGVGRRLYQHSDVSPAKVFECAQEVVGDVLLTYRDSEEIREFVQKYGFEARRIRMWNGHNSEQLELLIGTDLSWTHGSK